MMRVKLVDGSDVKTGCMFLVLSQLLRASKSRVARCQAALAP
jgi:hypothetical protein